MGGNKIGKYEILGELGRGAMGIVYVAADPFIGRKVAIKTIRFDVISRPAEREEAQNRFMREARSAGILSHPNIVTIYDVGEDAGVTYIVMEYIEGNSLDDLIASRNRPPLEASIGLIAQIGDALDYAHGKGIVHRDIKPGNILIDREGKPHIVDFGIARLSASTMTQTKMVMGTPYYMAPEQIAGKRVDHRADIFSLGTILYEILTFEKPVPGESLTTVIYKIMNEEPRPPRDLERSLPSGLDEIVGKSLAKDPAARYQSCRELAEDLRKCVRTVGLEGVPEESRTISDAALEEKPRSRAPLFLVLGGMMATVLVVIFTVILTSTRGPERTDFATSAGGTPLPAPDRPFAESRSMIDPNASPGAGIPGAAPRSESQTKPGMKTTSETESEREAQLKAAIQSKVEVPETPKAKISGPEQFAKVVEHKAEEAQPVVDTDLEMARRAFENGNYQECADLSRAVLTRNPANTEAKKYEDLAVFKLAPVELKKMVDDYVRAIKSKDLLEYYRTNGTPDFYRAVERETELLVNGHEDFRASAGSFSQTIADNQRNSYAAEVKFSLVMTGLSLTQGTRVVIFEGLVTWTLEKSGRQWLITAVKQSSSR